MEEDGGRWRKMEEDGGSLTKGYPYHTDGQNAGRINSIDASPSFTTIEPEEPRYRKTKLNMSIHQQNEFMNLFLRPPLTAAFSCFLFPSCLLSCHLTGQYPDRYLFSL